MYRAFIRSPLGPLLLCGCEEALTGLYFADQKDCPVEPGKAVDPPDSPRSDDEQDSGVALRTLRPVRRMGEGQAQMTLFAADRREPQAGATVGEALAFSGQNDPDAPLAGGSDTANDEIQMLQECTPAGVRDLFARARIELHEYFAGSRTRFDLPLQLTGSPFQVNVWKTLCEVACGELVTYGQLAAMAGLGSGYGRAVGTAVGRNPVSIVVPCHRVIGSNQTLTGYTGGLSRKVALLELEGFAFV